MSSKIESLKNTSHPMNLLTFILLYLYICVFKKGKDWGKETTVNTFATSSFRSIKNFQHTVYWQVGEMGFAWVPQIDWLICSFWTIIIMIFVLQQSFTTNQLHHKGKHQKFLDLSSSQTSQTDPHPPPKAHYVTNTIAEHLISQLSHYRVCANQNQPIGSY